MKDQNKSVKKTSIAHGTLSEKVAETKAKNTKKVTEELLEEVIESEIEEEIEEKKVAVEEMVEKDKKERNQRRQRNVETTEELIARWEPKTNLGKEVKSGKIKSLDEILDSDKKILEPQIVDKLIPVKVDLISQGQAKGKFGGGKRRAWRQTQRITKEGGVLTFSAMAVIGDEHGHIGVGKGRANETLPARDKAVRKAKLNVMRIKRGCAAFDCNCSEKHTVPFKVTGKSGSVSVTLIPAPQGTGLVCANELKKVLKMAGIKDIYSKTTGKVRTTFNLVQACMEALKETNRI